jgi:hypothetical protein
MHDRKIGYEMREQNRLNEETVADHENLLKQYQRLELILQSVREEFNHFLHRTQN